MIAKLAHGLADDLLSSTLLEYDGPLVLAPAMHAGMWGAVATQANVATLLVARRAVRRTGRRAARPWRHGIGADERARQRSPTPSFAGPSAAWTSRVARVLVTAGPTHEPIDPVRYIGNRSSGQDGYRDRRRGARPGRDGDLGARALRRSRRRPAWRSSACRPRTRCVPPSLASVR